MLHASISEVTTLRWDLGKEIDHLVRHGFDAIALWRTKVSDIGLDEARSLLRRSGIRVSSLQWAGGFTGSDGRSFRESLADAREAIETAAHLGCPTVVVHTGCRGGHTVAHARRIVLEALGTLGRLAGREGVTLAVKPFHPTRAVGCGLVGGLAGTVSLVEACDDPAVGIALDCWQFAHEQQLLPSLPQVVPHLAVVQVADGRERPDTDGERLPPGLGGLPLADVVGGLIDAGYDGDVEFDLVGESVEWLGYDAVLARLRRVADAWSLEAATRRPMPRPVATRIRHPIPAALG
jgi:sugar phosphate isomerase/epimerase